MSDIAHSAAKTAAIPGQAAQPGSPEVENAHHTYVTSRIPLFVHILWVTFWIMAISYVLIYLIPALQRELPNPP